MNIKKTNSAAKLQKFEKLAAKFRSNTQKQQYKSAIIHARNALKIMPNHLMVRSDLAFCLLRDKQYQAAYNQYKIIFHAGEDAWSNAGKTWLDGLAEVCGWLGKEQELQRIGCLSLKRADQEVLEQAAAIVHQPQKRLNFNPAQPKRNIISFSLFGAQPKYCESAVLNVQVATELFPNWRCRFYLAEDVPTQVASRLVKLGAQVIHLNTKESKIHPLMWRFLVVDDENVDFYLIRDADSLLSEKEQAAVESWLDSEYHFHHMRDYFTHTELLLAGMWAGVRGALPKIGLLMEQFCSAHQQSKHFIDQHFLRMQLWPMIRNSLLCHDEIFKFHRAQAFPKSKPSRWQNFSFHIGSNCSYQELSLNCAKEAGQWQQWHIVDSDKEEVCCYQTQVGTKSLLLNLPFLYVDNINRGKWSIVLN